MNNTYKLVILIFNEVRSTFFSVRRESCLKPRIQSPLFSDASSVHPPRCHVGLRDRCCCGSWGWKFILCSLAFISTSKLLRVGGDAVRVCEERVAWDSSVAGTALLEEFGFQDEPSAGHGDQGLHVFYIKYCFLSRQTSELTWPRLSAIWVDTRLRGGLQISGPYFSPLRRTSVSSATLAGNAS